VTYNSSVVPPQQPTPTAVWGYVYARNHAWQGREFDTGIVVSGEGALYFNVTPPSATWYVSDFSTSVTGNGDPNHLEETTQINYGALLYRIGNSTASSNYHKAGTQVVAPVTTGGRVYLSCLSDSSENNLGYLVVNVIFDSSVLPIVGGCASSRGTQLYSCLQFTGYTTLDLKKAYLPSSSSSVVLWANANPLYSNVNNTIISQGAPINDQGYHILVQDQTLRCSFYGDDSVVSVESLFGSWVHISCVFDNSTGTRTIYLNRVFVQDTSSVTFLSSSQYSTQIGNGFNEKEGFHGQIRDVLIFHRALSASEIASIYSATTMFSPMFSSVQLALFLPLNETTGNIVRDTFGDIFTLCSNCGCPCSGFPSLLQRLENAGWTP